MNAPIIARGADPRLPGRMALLRLICAAPVFGLVLAVVDGAPGVRAQQRNTVAQVQYTITDLGKLPNSRYSLGVRLNNNGDVLGFTDRNVLFRSFLLSGGIQTEILTDAGAWCQCVAFNDSDQIVGWAGVGEDGHHAFIWSAGVMTDLGTLGFPRSRATDINSTGQVVGFAEGVSPRARGFLWSGGTMTDLGTLPGGSSSLAYAINDTGVIAGAASIDDDAGRLFWHAVVWINGTMTNLGRLGGVAALATDINEAGQLIGDLWVDPGLGGLAHHAFLYSGGAAIDLGTLGGLRTFVRRINAAGDVIGYSDTAASGPRAVLYRGNTLIDLVGDRFGPTTWSQAYGINSAGHVVGRAFDVNVAFLYREGTVFDLNDLIAPDSGWDLGGAFDINDAGQIVGGGVINGEGHAFRLDPIP